MRKPLTACVYCLAPWFGEAFPDPEHRQDCPMATNVFPVDDDMVCMDCGAELVDFYTHRPCDVDDVADVVCLGCAALALAVQ